MTDREHLEMCGAWLNTNQTLGHADAMRMLGIALAGLNEPPDGAVKVRIAVGAHPSGYASAREIDNSTSEREAIRYVHVELGCEMNAFAIVTAWIPKATTPEVRGRVE